MAVVENDIDLYMGFFGLSWQEKVSKYMQKVLTGNISAIKNVKNSNYINNLYLIYVAGLNNGVPVPTMSKFDSMVNHFKSNRVPESIAKSWINAVYTLSQNGSIDLKIYDPLGTKKMISEKENVTGNAVKSTLNSVGTIAKSLKSILIIGGVAVGLFYINSITRVFKPVSK